MKKNRKECKAIAGLTEELVKGLLAETEGVEEEDLGERSRLSLAELEWWGYNFFAMLDTLPR